MRRRLSTFVASCQPDFQVVYLDSLFRASLLPGRASVMKVLNDLITAKRASCCAGESLLLSCKSPRHFLLDPVF